MYSAGCLFPKGYDGLEEAKRRAAKMMQDVEVLPSEDRLKGLGIFSLEEHRLR